MAVLLETILFAGLFYAVTFCLGLGLTRILLDGKKTLEIFYAPWIGIAQTGLILIPFGFLNVGTNSSLWAAIGAGIVFYATSRFKPPSVSLPLRSEASAKGGIERLKIEEAEGLQPDKKTRVIVPIAVLFVCTALMLPVMMKSKKMTSFTIGNNDLFDYIVTAQRLQNHGLRPFLKPFGEQPDWEGASVSERVVSWQIPAPRWLSYYYLSFLSSLFRNDPSTFFSLYINFLFALMLPVIWLFAKDILKLNGVGLGIGSVLVLFNPHILYILFNTFLPQIAATGFFACFLSQFPRYAESERIEWRKLILSSIFAAGALACYLEVFSFLFFILTVYLFWLAVSRQIGWSSAVKKWLALLTLIVLFCPYQASRFLSIVLWHSGMKGGGWQISDHYYLFLYQLGGFFSLPHRANPTLILEWLVNPLLLFLIVRGIKTLKYKSYALIIIVPFVVAGLIAYRNDWNYRYYKNFTYIYFWLPLIIGSGAAWLSDWLEFSKSKQEKLKWLLGQSLFGAVIFIALLAGVKTCEGIVIWTLNNRTVPSELKIFSKLNEDSQIKTVFVAGMDFWESLWSAYFLRDKNVVLPTVIDYIRNDTGAIQDARFRYLLTKDDYSSAGLPEGRKIEKVLLESPPYSFNLLTP